MLWLKLNHVRKRGHRYRNDKYCMRMEFLKYRSIFIMGVWKRYMFYGNLLLDCVGKIYCYLVRIHMYLTMTGRTDIMTRCCTFNFISNTLGETIYFLCHTVYDDLQEISQQFATFHNIYHAWWTYKVSALDNIKNIIPTNTSMNW